MRNLLIMPFLALTGICYAQERDIFKDSKQWKDLEQIKILSTETVTDSTSSDSTALLKVKFFDYKQNRVRNYYADLDSQKREFVSHSEYYCGLGAMRQFSIMTVPFKVRAKNKDGYVTAKADLDNVGFYIPLGLKNIERYWVDNSSSSHKISYGILLAPMAEELNDKNTQNYFGDEDKSYTAFMFSTSLAVTYTYKKITLALIPVGFDFGTDKAGRQWINHGKYWFGFGLGIDTELFNF